MFEICLSNNKQSPFIIQPAARYGYDSALHEVFEYADKFITINGLKYLHAKNDFNVDDKFVVLISGKVFNSLEYSEDLNPLLEKDILDLYLISGKKFLEKIKGNFIILIYNKITKTIFIAKDQLGLKYLYYKIEDKYFYISTNLNDFKSIHFEYNYSAVIEKILFTYPIGVETFIKNVFMLELGCILTYTASKFENQIYFSIEDLFPQNIIGNHFNKKHFLELFEKSVLQRANVSEKINVSLTGGFDGRANISVLLKNDQIFQTYSFGKKGGENTIVPIDVSKKLGIDYFPVYLDEEYEKKYSENALDSIYFSDGISIFERANYIFTLKQIANYSNYNLTGLIGGEIFAPVHLKVDYINKTYFNLIYLAEKVDLIDILSQKTLSSYLNLEFLKQKEILEKIEENIKIRGELIREWKNQEFKWMYYLKDLMTLGFQRFYGIQMHLERYYCENLTPFYDLDIIRYLFSTDHINIYSNAFKSSPLVRRNNRWLQSMIIKNSFPELGEIPVDRGYPPNYNLDCRKVFIPYIFYKRRQRLKDAIPDFTSPIWCQILFKEKIKEINAMKEKLFITKEIHKSVKDYDPVNYFKEFNQLLSTAIWLSVK
jgi:hypothetical protein